jgi:hypothetical protein
MYGPRRKNGAYVIRKYVAMPVSVAEPVRSRTANATAIGARYVPK